MMNGTGVAIPARDDSGLSWVIVNGAPRSVSDFASIAPRQRPAASCPHCGQRLTLKLGPVLRHHAAHRSDAECPATRPESALHLDCKFALGAALRAAAGSDASLTFRRSCAGVGSDACGRVSLETWQGGWDEVRVEHRLFDARRPDLLLLRGGVRVGALEIVVSHAVDADKAKALAALGLPWAEIDADPARRDANDWHVGEALAVRRLNDVRPWRCAAHEGEAAFRASTRMAVREPVPTDWARSTVLRAARVVDIYHPSGRRERFIYSILQELELGVTTARVLTRGTLEIARIADDGNSGRQSGARAALQLAFHQDVEKLRGDDGPFVDSPMHWAQGGAAEFIVHEAVFDRRLPDPTVLATTYPRRWFYSPRSGRWFLPDEMRDVHWDRDADDPFAPHPAARRSAAPTSSSHPAREGSWSTLIFARRPTATMFGRAVNGVPLVPGIVRVDVPASRTGQQRSVFVIEGATGHGVLARLTSTSARDALWLSHPRDWSAAFEDLAWVAAGCDQRGRGAVLIDGVGVYRADAFIRAVAARDRRLTTTSVRRAMAARVERLRARASAGG